MTMSKFIVQPEKGALVPDANSYVTAEAVRVRANMRGVLLSGVDDEDLERAAVAATREVDARYGRDFTGPRPGRRGLHWPKGLGYDDREDMYNFFGVPTEVQEIVCDVAATFARGEAPNQADWSTFRDRLKAASLIGYVDTDYPPRP